MLLRVLALFLATAMFCWLTNLNLHHPDLAQRTDFLNSCYVAGKICAMGMSTQLYPPMTADSEVGYAFTKIAHQLMPLLLPNSAPVWQCAPIDAGFFELFTAFTPQVALILWQCMTVAAALCSALIVSKFSKVTLPTVLALFVLFLPDFFHVKVGQQGLVLGLLPLLVSMQLLDRKHPFIAGLVAAVTFLTLKYFVVAGLISLALLRIERKYFLGLTLGALVAVAICFTTFPVLTMQEWCHSIALSEKYFFEPHFRHVLTLYTSLPAVAIFETPVELRAVSKVFFYAVAVVAALAPVFLSLKISKSALNMQEKLCFVFATALLAMPVSQPHLLFYDLSPLMSAIILLWNLDLQIDARRALRALSIAMFLLVDAYFISFAFFPNAFISPLFFCFCLAIIYAQLLNSVRKISQGGTDQIRT